MPRNIIKDPNSPADALDGAFETLKESGDLELNDFYRLVGHSNVAANTLHKLSRLPQGSDRFSLSQILEHPNVGPQTAEAVLQEIGGPSAFGNLSRAAKVPGVSSEVIYQAAKRYANYGHTMSFVPSLNLEQLERLNQERGDSPSLKNLYAQALFNTPHHNAESLEQTVDRIAGGEFEGQVNYLSGFDVNDFIQNNKTLNAAQLDKLGANDEYIESALNHPNISEGFVASVANRLRVGSNSALSHPKLPATTLQAIIDDLISDVGVHGHRGYAILANPNISTDQVKQLFEGGLQAAFNHPKMDPTIIVDAWENSNKKSDAVSRALNAKATPASVLQDIVGKNANIRLAIKALNHPNADETVLQTAAARRSGPLQEALSQRLMKDGVITVDAQIREKKVSPLLAWRDKATKEALDGRPEQRKILVDQLHEATKGVTDIDAAKKGLKLPKLEDLVALKGHLAQDRQLTSEQRAEQVKDLIGLYQAAPGSQTLAGVLLDLAQGGSRQAQEVLINVWPEDPELGIMADLRSLNFDTDILDQMVDRTLSKGGAGEGPALETDLDLGGHLRDLGFLAQNPNISDDALKRIITTPSQHSPPKLDSHLKNKVMPAVDSRLEDASPEERQAFFQDVLSKAPDYVRPHLICSSSAPDSVKQQAWESLDDNGRQEVLNNINPRHIPISWHLSILEGDDEAGIAGRRLTDYLIDERDPKSIQTLQQWVSRGAKNLNDRIIDNFPPAVFDGIPGQEMIEAAIKTVDEPVTFSSLLKAKLGLEPETLDSVDNFINRMVEWGETRPEKYMTACRAALMQGGASELAGRLPESPSSPDPLDPPMDGFNKVVDSITPYHHHEHFNRVVSELLEFGFLTQDKVAAMAEDHRFAPALFESLGELEHYDDTLNESKVVDLGFAYLASEDDSVKSGRRTVVRDFENRLRNPDNFKLPIKDRNRRDLLLQNLIDLGMASSVNLEALYRATSHLPLEGLLEGVAKADLESSAKTFNNMMSNPTKSEDSRVVEAYLLGKATPELISECLQDQFRRSAVVVSNDRLHEKLLSPLHSPTESSTPELLGLLVIARHPNLGSRLIPSEFSGPLLRELARRARNQDPEFIGRYSHELKLAVLRGSETIARDAADDLIAVMKAGTPNHAINMAVNTNVAGALFGGTSRLTQSQAAEAFMGLPENIEDFIDSYADLDGMFDSHSFMNNSDLVASTTRGWKLRSLISNAVNLDRPLQQVITNRLLDNTPEDLGIPDESVVDYIHTGLGKGFLDNKTSTRLVKTLGDAEIFQWLNKGYSNVEEVLAPEAAERLDKAVRGGLIENDFEMWRRRAVAIVGTEGAPRRRKSALHLVQTQLHDNWGVIENKVRAGVLSSHDVEAVRKLCGVAVSVPQSDEQQSLTLLTNISRLPQLYESGTQEVPGLAAERFFKEHMPDFIRQWMRGSPPKMSKEGWLQAFSLIPEARYAITSCGHMDVQMLEAADLRSWPLTTKEGLLLFNGTLHNIILKMEPTSLAEYKDQFLELLEGSEPYQVEDSDNVLGFVRVPQRLVGAIPEQMTIGDLQKLEDFVLGDENERDFKVQAVRSGAGGLEYSRSKILEEVEDFGDDLEDMAWTPHWNDEMGQAVVKHLRDLRGDRNRKFKEVLLKNPSVPFNARQVVEDLLDGEVENLSQNQATDFITDGYLTDSTQGRELLRALCNQADDTPRESFDCFQPGGAFSLAVLNPTHGPKIMRSLTSPELLKGFDRVKNIKPELLTTRVKEESKNLMQLKALMDVTPAEGISWPQFKKDYKQLANQAAVKQLFQLYGRGNKPVLPEQVAAAIEDEQKKAKDFHISYSMFKMDTQKHDPGRNKAQFTVQLNWSEAIENELKDDPQLWDFARNLMYEANQVRVDSRMMGSHPTTPYSIGWSRVDTHSGKRGWIVEEIQSDMERIFRKLVESKISKSESSLEVLGRPLSRTKIAEFCKRISKAHRGWQQALYKAVEENARNHGVEKLYVHGANFRAKLSSIETPPGWYETYQDLPQKLGFKKCSYHDYPHKGEVGKKIAEKTDDICWVKDLTEEE